MRLVIEKQAAKILARMPVNLSRSIVAALEAIAAAPYARHANVKPLVGTENGYRLRRGDWRVLYRLDRKAGTMFVEVVKTRGGVYK